MKKTKILFEGHDLKFLSHIIEHYKANREYDVEVITYSGHEIKDLTEIQRVLPAIDIVFCEWGLGNLRWFSRNKLPGQKIITRIHSQEFFTDYLHETHWSQVTKIIFVSQHILNKFIALFPGSSEKCVMIHNMVACDLYPVEKTEDAKYHLGLLGVLPKIKDPLLGLQILSELKREDHRYKLFIKGKKPRELDWLWKKEQEQQYYNKFYSAIEDLKLSDSVSWEPEGKDVPDWFRKIGFILSTSEREAFHLAVAEGMAAGTVPVIKNWEGSRELFPAQFSFTNVAEAVALIRKLAAQQDFDKEAALAQQYCKAHFDVKIIVPEYDKIMFAEFDASEVRGEYYKVANQNIKLSSDLDGCIKFKEKNEANLNDLLIGHKELIGNNSVLTSEISGIRIELVKTQETNHQLAGHFDRLQHEHAAMREAFSHELLDISRITNELQDQIKLNNNLREEIIILQQENQGHKNELVNAGKENQRVKEMLSAENENIRISLGNEKSLIKEALERENLLIKDTLEKVNLRLTEEFTARKAEKAALILKLEHERSVLLERIDHLKNINHEMELHQLQTLSSLTWKVGAILVKKPADLISGITKKLLPRK